MPTVSRKQVNAIFALIGENRLDDAEHACRKVLGEAPDDVNVLGLLGAILLKKGDAGQAETFLLRTIELEPAFAKPHEDLGALYLSRNEPERAIPFFEKVVALDASQASAARGLAAALLRAGRGQDAEALQRQLQANSPLGKLLTQAEEFRKSGQFEKAEQVCQDILKTDAENIAALRLLAVIASEEERFVIAEGLLRRIAKLAPQNSRAMRDLGQFLADRGRYPEAIEVIESALRIDAHNASLHLALGDMLSIVGRSDHALGAYEKCLALKPDEPPALLGRGHMLRIAGRSDEALASYRRCAEVVPGSGDAWWNMASLRNYEATDGDVRIMQAQLESGRISAESAVAFHFALARAYEDRADFEAAWQHYKQGNAGKRALVKYDPVETEYQQRKIKDVFDNEAFQQKQAGTPTDLTPIFILGMPRSGSTLVEQILASHSRVEGTGELPYIIMMSSGLAANRRDGVHYPELIRELDVSQLTGLGRSYLHHARTHCKSSKPFFTDKMPANFSHAGFIRLILPHARIIDARREPMATCVANFRQLFAQGKNQSYDLTELGEYYLQYVETMAHWDKVMPGAVLRVQYEEVVADLEGQVRRMLDFCGLEFDPACVQFHKSDRPVNTASSEQVRQPIYDSAVEFWRHYDAYLDELREVLAPVL